MEMQKGWIIFMYARQVVGGRWSVVGGRVSEVGGHCKNDTAGMVLQE